MNHDYGRKGNSAQKGGVLQKEPSFLVGAVGRDLFFHPVNLWFSNCLGKNPSFLTPQMRVL